MLLVWLFIIFIGICISPIIYATDLPTHAAQTADALSQHIPEPFSLHTLISMVGSLALIIIILLAIKHFLLRHRSFGQPFKTKHLKIVQTISLSMRDKILIVEIDDNWMIVGVTAQGMNTLYTMPKPHACETTPLPKETMSFSRYFNSILDKKKTSDDRPQ